MLDAGADIPVVKSGLVNRYGGREEVVVDVEDYGCVLFGRKILDDGDTPSVHCQADSVPLTHLHCQRKARGERQQTWTPIFTIKKRKDPPVTGGSALSETETELHCQRGIRPAL